MGMELAAATLATSARSPAVSFPSLISNILVAVSGGAIASASSTPLARALCSPGRVMFRRGTWVLTDGRRAIRACSPTSITASWSPGGLLATAWAR